VSIPPFRLRFENNDSFEHRERRWIGRGIGASPFAQDMIDFRKIHQDLIRQLQRFLRRAGHPGGCHDVRGNTDTCASSGSRIKLGAELKLQVKPPPEPTWYSVRPRFLVSKSGFHRAWDSPRPFRW